MKEEVVYLIGRKNTDFVKIGITNNLDTRFQTIKEKYKDIELLAYYICPDRKYSASLEKKLHNLLEHKRIQFEWFILKTDEILLVHDCIINFYKLKCWHKSECLRDKEIQYNKSCKIFIPNAYNEPYFF
jgi:hypothetical protein